MSPVLFSYGSDEYSLVGHDREFDECHLLGDASQIKKMTCGRSHILYETKNGQVFCIGRNDYSQCGVLKEKYGITITQPVQCMYKDEGCQPRPLIKPFKFTSGWFHSTFISADQKRIYFSGYYSKFSSMGQTKDTYFYDLTNTVLEKDMIEDNNYKITDIGSGDHFFAFVVNGEFIVVVDASLKVLRIPGLKEFLVYKSGVAFTTGDGNIYLAKNYPNSLTKYDGKYPINLSSASVADSFSFQLLSTNETVRFDEKSYPISMRVYDSFCVSYMYDTSKRQFTDHKFARINKELEIHPNWEILQFVSGSDTIHILLGVKETRDQLLFFEKMNSLRQGNMSDILLNFNK